MKKRIILSILLIAFITTYSQTTYYIDPDIVGGTGDGLSAANAFSDWHDASFSANNTYLQKRSTVYNLSTAITFDGIAGIHIGAYGSGNDFAYINDVRTTGSATTACFSVGNTEGLLIDSLSFYGVNFPTFMATAAISTGASEWSAVTNDNVTIKDCRIRRFEWGIRAMTYLWSTEANTDLKKFKKFKVTRCKIDSCYDDGIFMQRIGGDVVTDTAITISYNDITKVNLQYDYAGTWAGDCIQYSATITGIYNISHNRLVRVNYEKFDVIFNTKGTGTTGLLRGDGGKVIIEDNYIDAPETNASAMYLTVHWLWPQNDSVQFIVRNNYITGDGVNGISCYTDDATQNHSCEIYNNIFVNLGTCINSAAPTDAIRVYNNTFVNYTTAIKHPNLDARNNIFISSTTPAIVTSGEWTLNRNANWYTNISDPSISANDSIGNIPFVDSSALYNFRWLQNCNLTVGQQIKDFRIQSSSHTIDGGGDIAISNYDIDSTLYTGAYDIGAYEYVANAPKPPSSHNKVYLYKGRLVTKHK